MVDSRDASFAGGLGGLGTRREVRRGELAQGSEEARLLEVTWQRFVNEGARLSDQASTP